MIACCVALRLAVATLFALFSYAAGADFVIGGLFSINTLEGSVSAAMAALAVADVNKHHPMANGENVRFEIRNTNGQGTDTTREFVNLVDGPFNISGFVGGVHTDAQFALQSASETFKIPAITNGISSRPVVEADDSRAPFFLHSAPTLEQLAEALISTVMHFDWLFATVIFSADFSEDVRKHIPFQVNKQERALTLNYRPFKDTSSTNFVDAVSDAGARVFLLIMSPKDLVAFFAEFSSEMNHHKIEGISESDFAFIVSERSETMGMPSWGLPTKGTSSATPNGTLFVTVDSANQDAAAHARLRADWSNLRSTLPNRTGITQSDLPLLWSEDTWLSASAGSVLAEGIYAYDAVWKLSAAGNASKITHPHSQNMLQQKLISENTRGVSGHFTFDMQTGQRKTVFVILNKQYGIWQPALQTIGGKISRSPRATVPNIMWTGGKATTVRPREYEQRHSALTGAPPRCLDNVPPKPAGEPRGPQAHSHKIKLAASPWAASHYATELLRIVLEEWLDFKVEVVRSPAAENLIRSQVLYQDQHTHADANMLIWGTDRLIYENVSDPIWTTLPLGASGLMGFFIWLTSAAKQSTTPIPTELPSSYADGSLLYRDYLPRLHDDEAISGHSVLSSGVPNCNPETFLTYVYPCKEDSAIEPLLDCDARTKDAERACGVIFIADYRNTVPGNAIIRQARALDFKNIAIVFLGDDVTLIEELSAPPSDKVVTFVGRLPSLLVGGAETGDYTERWSELDMPMYSPSNFRKMLSGDTSALSGLPPAIPLEKLNFAGSANGRSPLDIANQIMDSMVPILEKDLVTYLNRYTRDYMMNVLPAKTAAQRIAIAKNAACAWIRDEYAKGAYIIDGRPANAMWTKWIPTQSEGKLETDNAEAAELLFETPNWLSASLSTFAAKILVEESLFKYPKSCPLPQQGCEPGKCRCLPIPAFRVKSVHTSESSRVVGRAAHASDIDEAMHTDYAIEVWGKGASKLRDKEKYGFGPGGLGRVEIFDVGYLGFEGHFWAGPSPKRRETGEDLGGPVHWKFMKPGHSSAPSIYRAATADIESALNAEGRNTYSWTTAGFYLTKACVERVRLAEANNLPEQTWGPPCMGFAHPHPGWYTGSIEATYNNLGVPMNITYAGTESGDALKKVITDRADKGKATVFYWWVPDPMFANLKKVNLPWNKIKLPLYSAENKKTGDGTPYGAESTDFASQNLEVAINAKLKEKYPTAYILLKNIRVKSADINFMLETHVKLKEENPDAQAEWLLEQSARTWVDISESTWREWVPGCIDKFATNYNKFASISTSCDCNENFRDPKRRAGFDVCKLEDNLPRPINFQVLVSLNGDGASNSREEKCFKDNSCGCPMPTERNEQQIVYRWSWPASKNPDFFEIQIKNHLDTGSIQVNDELNPEQSFLIEGTERRFVYNMTHDNSEYGWAAQSYTPRIFSQSKFAKITALNIIGTREQRSVSEGVYGSYVPSKTWDTSVVCAKRGYFLNDTDCRPTEWACMECPTGAMCGSMCQFPIPHHLKSPNQYCDDPDESEETCVKCVLSTENSESPNNTTNASSVDSLAAIWIGGNTTNDWISSLPNWWFDMEAWRLAMGTGIVHYRQPLTKERDCSAQKGFQWVTLDTVLEPSAFQALPPAAQRHWSFQRSRGICIETSRRRKYLKIDAFRECLVSGSCPGGVGGNQCAQGADESSPLCSGCKAGYSKDSAGRCSDCSDPRLTRGSIVTSIAVLSLSFSAFIGLAILGYRKHQQNKQDTHVGLRGKARSESDEIFDDGIALASYEKQCTDETEKQRQERLLDVHENDMRIFHKFNRPMGVKFKVIVAFLQILAAFTKALPVNFSPQQHDVASVGSIADADFVGLMWIKCAAHTDYIQSLLFNTLFPEICGVVLPICGFLLLRVIVNGSKRLTAEKKKAKVQKIYDKCLQFSVTFLLFLCEFHSRTRRCYFPLSFLEDF